MAAINYRIEVFQKESGSYAHEFSYDTSPSVTITDSLSFDADKSIEASSDSFSFKVRNDKEGGAYRYRDNIKVDDRVRIYITSDQAITDDNKNDYVRFDGIISEVQYEVSVDGRFLFVKGNSRLDRVLNYTYPAVYEPTGSFTSTASNIIQDLLDAVGDNNANYAITWSATNDSTSEEIQFYRNYSPVIELIQELSTQKINGEFNAYFYLNSDNEFVWKQKSSNTDTISINEGKEFNKVKLSEKVWEVINAMIVDAGKDPSGNSIHAMHYDEASAGEYGLKWANTIEVKPEISSELIKDAKNSVGWTDNSDKNKQSFPNSYPLTLPWEDRNANGVLTGAAAVVSSDTEWVDAIRKEAKWQAIGWIKSVLDHTGHVRPKVDITMKGSVWEKGFDGSGLPAENCLDSNGNPIQQGDKITIYINSRGGEFRQGSGVKMRCIQVNHELGNKGWEVTMRFESDIDDAITYKATGH